MPMILCMHVTFPEILAACLARMHAARDMFLRPDAVLSFRAGGIVAAKQEIRAYPTRTNQIPRHIPPPHWASHPAVLYLAAGLLPFGTIFVELYFAMTSIWQVRKSVRLICHTAAML